MGDSFSGTSAVRLFEDSLAFMESSGSNVNEKTKRVLRKGKSADASLCSLEVYFRRHQVLLAQLTLSSWPVILVTSPDKREDVVRYIVTKNSRIKSYFRLLRKTSRVASLLKSVLTQIDVLTKHNARSAVKLSKYVINSAKNPAVYKELIEFINKNISFNAFLVELLSRLDEPSTNKKLEEHVISYYRKLNSWRVFCSCSSFCKKEPEPLNEHTKALVSRHAANGKSEASKLVSSFEGTSLIDAQKKESIRHARNNRETSNEFLSEFSEYELVEYARVAPENAEEVLDFLEDAYLSKTSTRSSISALRLSLFISTTLNKRRELLSTVVKQINVTDASFCLISAELVGETQATCFSRTLDLTIQEISYILNRKETKREPPIVVALASRTIEITKHAAPNELKECCSVLKLLYKRYLLINSTQRQVSEKILLLLLQAGKRINIEELVENCLLEDTTLMKKIDKGETNKFFTNAISKLYTAFMHKSIKHLEIVRMICMEYKQRDPALDFSFLNELVSDETKYEQQIWISRLHLLNDLSVFEDAKIVKACLSDSFSRINSLANATFDVLQDASTRFEETECYEFEKKAMALYKPLLACLTSVLGEVTTPSLVERLYAIVKTTVAGLTQWLKFKISSFAYLTNECVETIAYASNVFLPDFLRFIPAVSQYQLQKKKKLRKEINHTAIIEVCERYEVSVLKLQEVTKTKLVEHLTTSRNFMLFTSRK